jgi:hypothetical protein
VKLSKKASTNGFETANRLRGPEVEGSPESIGDLAPNRRRLVVNDPNLSSIGVFYCTLVGRTPLISVRFTEKALQAMLDAQCGGPKAGRLKKDPEADFLNAPYVIGKRPKTIEEMKDTTYGVPALWFKAAMVRAAKGCGFSMTDAKVAVFVLPEDRQSGLVRLYHPKPPRMSIDPVRNDGIKASMDLRARPYFDEWSVKLKIEYFARMVSAEQIVAWLNLAGRGVGVGDWRPNGRKTTGIYGTFDLTEAEVSEPRAS